MKIKAPSRKHVLRALNRLRYFHYWLAPVQKKTKGRLAQGNKFNTRTRKPSEFVSMARKIEEEPTRAIYANL